MFSPFVVLLVVISSLVRRGFKLLDRNFMCLAQGSSRVLWIGE